MKLKRRCASRFNLFLLSTSFFIFLVLLQGARANAAPFLFHDNGETFELDLTREDVFLGEGATAIILKGRNLRTGELVAFRIFKSLVGYDLPGVDNSQKADDFYFMGSLASRHVMSPILNRVTEQPFIKMLGQVNRIDPELVQALPGLGIKTNTVHVQIYELMDGDLSSGLQINPKVLKEVRAFQIRRLFSVVLQLIIGQDLLARHQLILPDMKISNILFKEVGGEIIVKYADLSGALQAPVDVSQLVATELTVGKAPPEALSVVRMRFRHELRYLTPVANIYGIALSIFDAFCPWTDDDAEARTDENYFKREQLAEGVMTKQIDGIVEALRNEGHPDVENLETMLRFIAQFVAAGLKADPEERINAFVEKDMLRQVFRIHDFEPDVEHAYRDRVPVLREQAELKDMQVLTSRILALRGNPAVAPVESRENGKKPLLSAVRRWCGGVFNR